MNRKRPFWQGRYKFICLLFVIPIMGLVSDETDYRYDTSTSDWMSGSGLKIRAYPLTKSLRLYLELDNIVFTSEKTIVISVSGNDTYFATIGAGSTATSITVDPVSDNIHGTNNFQAYINDNGTLYNSGIVTVTQELATTLRTVDENGSQLSVDIYADKPDFVDASGFIKHYVSEGQDSKIYIEKLADHSIEASHPYSENNGLYLFDNVPAGDDVVVTFKQVLSPPALSISPVAKSFGSQNLNVSSANTSFEITNSGDETAEGTIYLSGLDPTQFGISDGAGNFSLAGGDSKIIKAFFKPNSSGEKTAKLKVDALNCPDVYAELTGAGLIAASFHVSPTTLSFTNQTMYSESEIKEILIKNEGQGNIVGNVTLTGVDPDQFFITSGDGSFSLGEYSSKQIGVKYAPSLVGDHQAEITISNSTGGDIIVGLAGTCIEEQSSQLNNGSHVDGYLAPNEEKRYSITIDDATSVLIIASENIEGDPVDLYVAKDRLPTDKEYDVMSFNGNGNERIRIDASGSDGLFGENGEILNKYDLALTEGKYEILVKAFENGGNYDVLIKTLSLSFPFDRENVNITRAYNTPKTHVFKDKYALDFAEVGCDSYGQKILAPESGKISRIRSLTIDYGRSIEIDHGYGYKSLLAHAATITAHSNQQIEKGMEIATIGNSGNAIGESCSHHGGTHIHYSFYKDGATVVPEPMSGKRGFVAGQYHNGPEANNPQTFIIVDNSNNETLAEIHEGYGGTMRSIAGAGEGSPGSASMIWEPQVAVAGQYSVYAHIPSQGATARNATYSITHSMGTEDVVIDQSPYNNQWILLGTYNFAQGNNGNVTLTNSNVIEDELLGFDAMLFTEPDPSAGGLVGVPVDVLATSISDSEINIGWRAPEVPTTHYNIYINDAFHATVPAAQLQYRFENLSSNTDYCFYVTAVSDGTESNPSNDACAKTELPAQITVDASFRKGINGLCLGVETPYMSFDTIFKGYADKIEFIKSEDGSIWIPNKINQISLNPLSGYVLKSSEDFDLELIGAPVGEAQVMLKSGWNYFGNFKHTPTNIEEAFLPISESIEFVKDIEGNLYLPGKLDQIQYLQPGKLYLIKMKAQATINL